MIPKNDDDQASAVVPYVDRLVHVESVLWCTYDM